MEYTTPNSEILIPNGRKADGSMNNTLVQTKQAGTIRSWSAVTDQVFVVRSTGGLAMANRYYESEIMPTDNDYSLWYQPSTNLMRYNGTNSDLTDESDTNWQLGYGVPICYIGDGQNINLDEFLSRPTFHALDKSDLPFMWSKTASLTSSNNPSAVIAEGTGYIKYSSGVMIQWGILNETSRFPVFTLNQPYINSNYVDLVSSQAGGSADRAVTSIYNYSTTWFQARIQNDTAGEFRWMTIGMWK